MGDGATARLEGTLSLGCGRAVGFAEYGAAEGRPVLWFHGTPGGRRQIPPAARRFAARRGVRLIALERPGVGGSTPHLHGSVLGWAGDVEEVADRLGLERIALVGLSGGGPYVLACAHELGDRVVAGAVLGGVAPARGEDAAAGGAMEVAARLTPLLGVLRHPLGLLLRATVQTLRPLASQAVDLYAWTAPEGDREVFRRPELREMFIDDIVCGARDHFHAPVYDLMLFGRPWGFSPKDIRVPIRLWHGDADNLVPLSHAEHLAELIPDAELRVRPREGHLGNLAAAEEILETLLSLWPREERPRSREPAADARRPARPSRRRTDPAPRESPPAPTPAR